MSNLSPAQKHAVHARGHLLVAACPGAGKTTVLKFRAEALLTSEPDTRLAAVTFTAEAAASLKARISAQYAPAARRVDAGTFHNLCGQQLRSAGQFKPLINEGKSAMWIRMAMQSCPIQDANFTVLDDFQAAIQAWQREVAPAVPSIESSAPAWVYDHYTKQKHKNGVRDFGDLIRDAVIGMRDGSVQPLHVDFMLVDEFQDTDNMQLEWVLEHAARGVEVTIVGDDDQSIYGWRGSLGYEGMLRFQSKTDAQLVTLDRTFRCTLPVLQPAAVLISHNLARVPKSLVTSNREPGEVRVRGFKDREQEVTAIVRSILDLGNPKDWCVISRTNALLDEVEARFAQYDITYNRSGGKSFWDQKAPGMLVSMASSMSRRDMMGLGDLMQHAKVRPSVIEALSRDLRFDAAGSLDRFHSASIPRSASSADRELVTALQTNSREWSKLSRTPSGLQLALNGMAMAIFKHYPWSDRDRAEQGKRLAQAAGSIASMHGSLSQRINALSRPKKKDADGVSLLTMHAAKGLEFDHVWIIGSEEGVIPSSREGSDVDEERRLMYVAITRAKADLTLSYTLERKPSAFLRESRLLAGSMFDEPRAEEQAAYA